MSRPISEVKFKLYVKGGALMSRRVPVTRLSGFGFITGAVLTAEASPGSIALTLCKDGLDRYKELVSFARANKMQLLQVRKDAVVFIELPSYLLAKAGFARDDCLHLSASYGLIQIQKPLS